MRERLPYKVPTIDYGQQGKPPKSKFENWPKGAIYSLVVNEKIQLPDGVTKDHYAFLEDAVLSGSLDKIDPNLKSVYLTYFTTNHSVRDLPGHFGHNPVTRFRRINYAIKGIWKAMPDDLREKYDPQKIKKLKGMHGARGRSFSQKEREYFREIGRERMTPEFRGIISDAVSDSMTPTVRSKIRRRAIQISSTPEGKERLRKIGQNNGHRFTTEESRRVNAKRLESQIEELPREEREKNPLEGAIVNFRYLTSKKFPPAIKRFFRSHATSSYTWRPIDHRIGSTNGYISYNEGKLWYHARGSKFPVNTKTLEMIWNGESPFTMDQEAIRKFGIASKMQIRSALQIRMDSLVAFSQQPRTAQFLRKP